MAEKWNSLFARLVFIFLIAILPILIGNQILNNWLHDVIRQNAVDYASAQILNAQEEMEETVDVIVDQSQFMLSNRQVRKFVLHDGLSNADRYETIKNVKDLLYYLHSINPYLTEIRLCYPTIGMEVTASGKYKQMESDMVEVLSDFNKTGTRLYDREGQIHVGSVIVAGGEKYLYLDAEINMAYITSRASSERLFFIVNHQAQQIYSNQTVFSSEELFALFGQNGLSEVKEVALNGTDYLMISSYSNDLDCSFLELLPVHQVFRFLILFRRYTSLLMAVIAIGISFYLFLIFRQVQHPVRMLVRYFEQANVENLSQPISSHSYIYEFRTLADSCNRMNTRIQKLIDENYESTIRYQQAELKQLHAQINPHFLYNTFFILRHSISEEKKEHAKRLVNYLGKYFEYIADQSHHMVRLQKEYDFAVTYLNIQLIRFEGGIRADVEPLPEEISDLSVPHLILQPLFENALEHGITTSGDEGLIRLRFMVSPHTVQIHVEDNGSLLTDAQLAKMEQMLIAPTPEQAQHALINTHKRLKITYGDICGLAFQRSELGGLQVVMTILREQEKNK